METHARHALIGLFTLAVIAAGFTFVYWIKGSGGLSSRAHYTIQYERTVAGLLPGSPVHFNGKRVGEVASVDLDRDVPDRITVRISVTPDTPVRRDTKASIDFQGLTGAPVVALEGGSAAAPLLAGLGADAALVADKAAGESLSTSARQVMGRIDTLIADNKEALHSAIENFSKFSEALGRNSDRVDGILAGVERMTGGGKTAASGVYDLSPVTSFTNIEKAEGVMLFIADPSISFTLGQDKIMVRSGETLSDLGPGARWSDQLISLVQSRLIQSFENAGYLGQVSRPVEGAADAHQLAIDIRRFEMTAGDAPIGEIEFSAKLVDSEGKVVAAKIFASAKPAASKEVASAAAALNDAFVSTAGEVVAWAVAHLKGPGKRT